MQIILNAPGVHQRTKEAVEQELAEMMPRLKRLLFQFRPEEKTLRAHLATQKNSEFSLTLSMRMPGKNVVVERSGQNLLPLVTEMKQSLMEQIKSQTSLIRKDRLRKKRTRSGEAVQESAAPPIELSAAEADEEEFRVRFSASLKPVLQDLYVHVTRSIRLAQLAGDLPPNYLKPSDVVDNVILRAYEEGRKLQGEEVPPSALYQIGEGIVAQEIQTCRSASQSVSMEAEPPETPPHWAVNDLGDELLEFYQPEEVLLYSDIMPDHQVPDPVRVLDEQEQMRDISMCLSQLNPAARNSFLLNRVEGFEIFEIALMQDRAEEEIARDIERCEEHLVKTFPSRS